jgi:hypothetical protein
LPIKISNKSPKNCAIRRKIIIFAQHNLTTSSTIVNLPILPLPYKSEHPGGLYYKTMILMDCVAMLKRDRFFQCMQRVLGEWRKNNANKGANEWELPIMLIDDTNTIKRQRNEQTSRPFAKPKEPFFANAPKTI